MLGIALPPEALLAAAQANRSAGAGAVAAVTAAVTAAAPVAPAAILPPVLLLAICAVAGIATVLMLPGRREASFRKVGGAGLLGLGLIGVALLVRYAADHGGGMGVYFWAFSAVALFGAVRVVTHPRPVYSALYFVLTVFASAGLFILLWAEFMAAALVLIYAGAILVTYVFVIMLASSAVPEEPATGASAGDRTGASTGASAADDDFGDSARLETARLEATRSDAGNGDGSHVTVSSGGETARGASLAPIAEYDAVSRDPLVAAAIGFALMGVLLFVIFDRSAGLAPPHDRAGIGGEPRAVPMTDAQDGATQKLGVYLFQNHVVNLELAGLLLTVSMVGAIIIARRRVALPDADRAAAARSAEPSGVAAGTMSAIDDDPHAIPVFGTSNPRQKEYPEA